MILEEAIAGQMPVSNLNEFSSVEMIPKRDFASISANKNAKILTFIFDKSGVYE